MKSSKARNRIVAFSVAGVLLFIAFFCAICFGSVSLPFDEVFRSLFGASEKYGSIVKNLRLPRALACILCGVALSTSGVLLQRTSNNELASPNVIGVNAGAGLGVMLVLCFWPKNTAILPLVAFGGAMLAAALVIGISAGVDTHSASVVLILAGVAVGALLNAFIALLSQLYPDAVTSYLNFSSGGFSSVRWNDLPVPAIIIAVCFFLAFGFSKPLNLLLLGDELASSLGVKAKAMKWIAVILAALLTGASVSIAGLLGFVGLLVPHMARKIVGNNAFVLLPFSALLGSILVLLADLLGRAAFAPSEISAGILLAFLGAPFFVYLLFRRGGVHANP